jgi:hypothetical protein
MVLCVLFSLTELHAQDLELIGKAKPIRLSGSLSLQGGPYVYLGKGEPRNQPFWWMATSSPTMSIYGWQLPFSFSIGSQNRNFNQPFNRFGVSPYYKWATFHFGYRSIRFNPYVMSGLQFLGAGVELSPKKFRFAAFYGRFAKPIRQDSLSSITPTPAYKRMGYGVKLGLGNRRNFIDLMLFKAWDDTTSIPVLTPAAEVRPQENLVLGMSSRLAFTRRLNFQFDLAGSLLNRDIRLPILDTLAEINPVKSLFSPKLGGQLLTAGKASLNYTMKFIGLRLQYRRVDPDYRSLGAFYQQSDLQAVSIDPSIRLLRNKLRLNGSIGRQQDNLYRRKSYTSVRTIGSAGISYAPVKEYNVNLNYSNFGIEQQAGLQIINDTFRVAQTNQSLSLSQTYSRSDKVKTITYSLNMSYQALQDLNPYNTFAASENQVWYGNFFANRIRMIDNLNLSGGFNVSRNSFSTGNFLLIGPSLGVSKPFLHDKLQANLNVNINKGLQSGKSSGSTLNLYSGLNYQLSKSHQLTFTVNVLHNSTPFLSTGTFTEIRILGGYVLVFQPKQ